MTAPSIDTLATVLRKPLLSARAIVLLLFTQVEFTTLIFAIWNIAGTASGKHSQASGPAILSLFNVCLSFICVPIGLVSIAIPGSAVATVRYEVAWTFLLGALHIIAGLYLSASLSITSCPASEADGKYSFGATSCWTSIVLLPLVWTSAIIINAYAVALLWTVTLHMVQYPDLFRHCLYSVPWYSPPDGPYVTEGTSNDVVYGESKNCDIPPPGNGFEDVDLEVGVPKKSNKKASKDGETKLWQAIWPVDLHRPAFRDSDEESVVGTDADYKIVDTGYGLDRRPSWARKVEAVPGKIAPFPFLAAPPPQAPEAARVVKKSRSLGRLKISVSRSESPIALERQTRDGDASMLAPPLMIPQEATLRGDIRRNPDLFSFSSLGSIYSTSSDAHSGNRRPAYVVEDTQERIAKDRSSTFLESQVWNKSDGKY